MIAKAEKLDFGKETREKKEKKKKKKKARAVEEDALNVEPLVKTKPSQKSVAPPGMVPEMPLLKKKKKKKKKTQEAESPDRALHEDSIEAESMGRTNSLKKHHSRKELLPNPPQSPCQGKRKKTKSFLSHPPGAETLVDAELEGGLVRKPKKRKKDKKSDQESFGEQEPKEALPDPMTEEEEEEEKEKECEPIEQEQGEEKQDPSSLRDSGTKKKKKKKKKTYREEEKEDEEDCRTDKMPIDEGHIENPCAFGSCRKKDHKKKQPKAELAESVPLGDSPGNIKKKEKKSKTQIEPPFAEEPAQKKKMTEGRKVMQDLQGPGMIRRKALQEEIDRESGKTEALETKEEAPTQFGQWDTATFENSDQKMKFLRLMGGFKNSSPSLSSSSGTLGKPNMALNKQAAATLKQNLQVEFDRAMSWKHQRGVGFGYSASANKNKLFYIDRNASRSVKFND
ncbi:lysine-rich nucleolar protein 1-like isoform X2 [Vombatus ursinus]|uniref:Small acidic protein-like domain-containing protein n=1 Tax=Vombatus ursinus TaxID=29139 RepID=A0A4X2LPL6_VOMUR|nr:lysine-rich nucleolar protein 1-like isoform X2 [Vombatus ursinus]XP_027730275.1 lysine-rich nucleolar protein 1-like isoform X2 [Vombatus ursinus]